MSVLVFNEFVISERQWQQHANDDGGHDDGQLWPQQATAEPDDDANYDDDDEWQEVGRCCQCS